MKVRNRSKLQEEYREVAEEIEHYTKLKTVYEGDIFQIGSIEVILEGLQQRHKILKNRIQFKTIIGGLGE